MSEITPDAAASLPVSYPDDWEFDVVLRDGSTVTLRPILPDDGEGLQNLLARMSTTSVYQRFFRVKRSLSPDEVHYFTHVDYTRRMAFVAIEDGDLIAVGRYDQKKEDTDTAEVAFAVMDDSQGRGIGTQLLQHLTAYARRHGITAFRAFVLADNHAMIRVFRDAGFRMHRELDEGVFTVEFPTEVSPETRAADEERERTAIAASMMPLFYPHSVAVIGASRDPASIGGRLFKNLIDGGFTGPVYPINPSADVVRSVRAYPSIADVPGPVDLAFVVVPAKYVIETVEAAGAKGVKGIVVISAGFSETGEEGRRREEQLLDVVRDTGMRMVGPNCMGVLNTDPVVSLDGQFGPLRPGAGNVAMSSQSGALGIAILDYATRLNIGISTFVSVGNKADVSGNDLLLYWEDDPATDVILLYLESFGHARRFARIARRIAKRKPIVAVKSGRTTAGAKAASSHTGSLASLDVAADALFRQAGVIRTTTLSELFDVTSLLANQPLPEGTRVGVLTNAGGPAILAVDALVSQGLDVVEFSKALQAQLAEHLSPDAAVANPVDMIAAAGAAQYSACLDLLLESNEVDAVMAIYIPASPQGVEETADAIRRAAVRHHGRKTFLTVYMSAAGAPSELVSGEVRVPTYPFPEPAARALAKAADYRRWRDQPEGSVIEFADVDGAEASVVVDSALRRLDTEGGWLEPDEVDTVLRAYGLTLPRAATVEDADAAVAAAAEIGGPVVLKVISASALHKSDVGGVVLDVEGEAEVRAAHAQVVAAVDDPEGVLVQEFVGEGHEVLIGMTEDPLFGPLIVFGLGGVFVELVGDVAFRIHPLTDIEAESMIGSLKTARLLDGYRGGPAGDVAAVREALLRVSALIEHVPEIVEMDLNPVKVRSPGEGVRVVDARIRVRAVEGPWVPTRRDIPSVV